MKKQKKDPLVAFKIGFGLAFGLQPFEVLRTKLVLDKDLSKHPITGMFTLSKKILKNEGITGFWRGSTM